MRMRVLYLLSILLLSACGSPYRVGEPAPVESHGAPVGASRSGDVSGEPEIRAYRPPQQVAVIRTAPSSRAVRNLIARAAAQQKAGDYGGAQASLERALRIEPRNPRLWNRLAHLYLAQQAYGKAEQFAAKSNTLIRGNDALKMDNWDLIARARQAGGDPSGARRAREQARILQ